MHRAHRPRVLDGSARTFDVICAGEPLMVLDEDGPRGGGALASEFRPDGGAVPAALGLAARELRVGLASVFPDDSVHRALLERLSVAGVDVGGVLLESRTPSLLLVRGGARQVVRQGEEAPPLDVPERWQSRVLLLSSVSPVIAHAAALCKAARAARRVGTTVFVDVNARWSLWKGRDPRAILMTLREADVVWASAQDLFGLNLDVPIVRAALRSSAVLVMSDGAGKATASGVFGEVSHVLPKTTAVSPLAVGNAFTTSICLELARAKPHEESSGALWPRALERAHEVVAKASRR